MATSASTSQQESALSYADLCARILQKPCFSGPNGAAWQGVFGGAMDNQVNRLYYAVECRYPEVAPLDSLYYIANERGLERVLVIGTGGTLEAESLHRLRLKHAWTIWSMSGSQQGHKDELGWMGLNAVQVLRRKEFSTPPPVGSAYVRAFAIQVWSQFDILVRKPMPITELLWGSGWTWGDGSTFGSSLVSAEIEQIRRVIRTHKSAHDTCTYLYLDFNGGPIFGTFLWGDGTVYGGQGAVTTLVIGEAQWTQRGLL